LFWLKKTFSSIYFGIDFREVHDQYLEKLGSFHYRKNKDLRRPKAHAKMPKKQPQWLPNIQILHPLICVGVVSRKCFKVCRKFAWALSQPQMLVCKYKEYL
jgi:hypothetical protein